MDTLDKKNYMQIIFAFLTVASALGAVLYIFGSNLLFSNSDSCALNIWTREIIRNKSLVPKTFYYSTDVRMWNINIPMLLLWKIVRNQLLLRAIGVLIWTGVSICVLLITAKYVFKGSYLSIILVYLICPGGIIVTSMLWEQAAYLTEMMYVLIIPALFCFATDDDIEMLKFKGLQNRFRILTFCALFLLLALSTVVSLQYFIVPMIASLLLMFFIENKEQVIAANVRRLAIHLLYILVLGAIGLLCYYYLFGQYGNMPKTAIIADIDTLPTYIIRFISGVLYFYGFDFKIKLVSLAGTMSVIKAIIAVCLTFVFPIKLLCKYNELSNKVRFFMLDILLYNALAIFIILFCGYMLADYTEGTRMLIPGFVGLWVLSAYYIQKYYLSKTNIVSTLFICMFIICALIYVPDRYQVLNNYKTRSADLHDITDYLYEKKLRFGYATFWNANINTVLSNFKVEVAVVNFGDKKVIPYRWLGTSLYYEPEYHSGDTFVLLTKDEYADLSGNLEIYGTPKEVLEHGNYVITVFDYNISRNNFHGTHLYDENTLPDSGIVENYPYSDGMARQNGVLNETDGTFTTNGNNGHALYGPYAPVKKGAFNFTLYYDVIDNPNGDAVVGLFDITEVYKNDVWPIAQTDILADNHTAVISNVTFADLGDAFEHRVFIGNAAKLKIIKIEIQRVDN